MGLYLPAGDGDRGARSKVRASSGKAHEANVLVLLDGRGQLPDGDVKAGEGISVLGVDDD
jgi:hypothetical protein